MSAAWSCGASPHMSARGDGWLQVHRAVPAILKGWQARHVLGSGEIQMLLSSAFILLLSWF